MLESRNSLNIEVWTDASRLSGSGCVMQYILIPCSGVVLGKALARAMCLLRQHARQGGRAAESFGGTDASIHSAESVPIVAADTGSDMDLSVSKYRKGCRIVGECAARPVLRQAPAQLDGQLL